MNQHNPPLCVLCHSVLEEGGWLRKRGKPITYDRAYYCDNNKCLRYGLLSIYKLYGTGNGDL